MLKIKVKSVEFEMWPGLLTKTPNWEGWSYPDPMCTSYVKVHSDIDVLQYKMSEFEQEWLFKYGSTI